jgi:hypothetical protein
LCKIYAVFWWQDANIAMFFVGLFHAMGDWWKINGPKNVQNND